MAGNPKGGMERHLKEDIEIHRTRNEEKTCTAPLSQPISGMVLQPGVARGGVRRPV